MEFELLDMVSSLLNEFFHFEVSSHSIAVTFFKSEPDVTLNNPVLVFSLLWIDLQRNKLIYNIRRKK